MGRKKPLLWYIHISPAALGTIAYMLRELLRRGWLAPRTWREGLAMTITHEPARVVSLSTITAKR